MGKFILGIHSGHDASACLMKDNKIICAIAKERITRKKHDSGEPIECIEYILSSYGLNKNDIDLVIRCNWFDSSEINDNYYKCFKNVIIMKNHHLFHAYAASLSIDTPESLIVIMDGRGCRPQDNGEKYNNNDLFETESIYLYKNSNIVPLEKKYSKYYKNKYQWGSHIDSLGYLYSAVSKIIFENKYAAGKVMALASLGGKNEYIPSIFTKSKEFIVNNDWLEFVNSLEMPINWNSKIAKDLSYSIQNGLEEYYSLRISEIISKHNIKNITLGGGVALNCKNNGILANNSIVENCSVFCASGDDGLSIGAAVWAYRNIFKEQDKILWDIGMGKNYFLNENKNRDELALNIALLLVANKYVGIVSGGSEYGPRALGNRSILANPSKSETKDNLNINIKQREVFRPFGGMILAKNLEKITDEKLASPHMLSAVHVKNNVLEQVGALTHIDGTIRLQIIDDTSSLCGKILEKFEELSGSIILLNTSFNAKGEPIVETEAQAIKCAKNIGLDYIVVGERLLKTDNL